MPQPIQEHPHYHEGFFDAMDGEPLFDDCPSAEYRAGWEAWWRVHSIVNDENFLATPAAKHLPADAGRHRFNN